MSIQLDVATRNLTAWVEASERLAKGMQVTVEGVTLTRTDVAQVQSMINYWQRVINNINGGGPLDGTVVRVSESE